MRFAYVLACFAASVVVNASPYPQAVTSKISPSSSPPAGCALRYPGIFGIAVLPLRSPNSKRGALASISQIGDGQIQAPPGLTYTMAPVTQIADGQIQAPTAIPGPPVVTQIDDGQIQAPTRSYVTVTSKSTTVITVAPVTQISDAQPQAPTTTQTYTSVMTSIVTMSGGNGHTQASGATESSPGSDGSGSFACRKTGSLELTLADGILTDAMGRTGYIASNYQFQFDAPPQAEALYTAGFSACKNGSLALGASTVWWQCLSGDFYNLYDRHWATQCEPIELTTVDLIKC